MTKNDTLRSLLIIGILVGTGTDLDAQVSFGGRPWAQHAMKMGLPEAPAFTAPLLDLEALFAEDAQRAADGNKRLRFGVNHATDLNLDNSGVWSELPNGDRVWRLRLSLSGATSTNFEFHEYVVPEGAMVHVYTPEGERLGGFTAASNPGHTKLGVGLLPGGEVTIEYDEPAAVAGQGRLRIGQVTQGYRDSFHRHKGFNESLACNNNVICPEGDPWRDQIRSVARIVVGGGDWCTGSLINNCANDGTPYFLTANHCMDGDPATWVFAFNWESSNCATNVNTPMDQTVSGATLLETNPGSDMALLQLNSVPPAAYGVYYSGWDASGNAPEDQIGIHHPSGDQKKISFNGETSAEEPYGGASCWQVDAWDDGTTEGGSSGSGLWNQNGLLVGQLYGGTFGCNCTDYYGRFNVSYPVIENHLGSCGPILTGYDPNQALFAVDGAIQSISGIPGVLCNNSTITPSVTIRNAGTDPLTSLEIGWELLGGTSGSQDWSGNLNSGATTTITLPAITVGNGAQTITVTCTSPNGGTDPNALNNTRSFAFTVNDPAAIAILAITLDNYGGETTWELFPENGQDPLYTGGPYTNFTEGEVESTEFCLGEGCYRFVIHDDAADGICCGYGEGSYLIEASGTMLVVGDGEFAEQLEHEFCITNTGIHPAGEALISLRPNPTTGPVELRLPSQGSAQVEVLDMAGRQVYHGYASNGRTLLDLSAQAEGIYVVKVTAPGSTHTARVAVRH